MEESGRRRRSLRYCKLNHVTKLIDEKESGKADDVENLEPYLKFFKPEGDESEISKEADRVIVGGGGGGGFSAGGAASGGGGAGESAAAPKEDEKKKEESEEEEGDFGFDLFG